MSLGVHQGLLKWPYILPYRTVLYPTALYRNEYKYVARLRTIPKRVFPYGIHVVLEIREEVVSWAPRGFIYVAAAKIRITAVSLFKPANLM